MNSQMERHMARSLGLLSAASLELGGGCGHPPGRPLNLPPIVRVLRDGVFLA